MSDEYLKKFGNKKPSKEELRKFHQRPGRYDKDGNPIYTTEQNVKAQCDVNNIIKRYDRSGVLTHITNIEAKFGDMTGADFQAMQNQVATARSMFSSLPAEIRNRFDNEPSKLLEFMEHEENRDEAIKMGLINPEWDSSLDGLGEHVTKEEAEIRDSGDNAQTE